MARQRIVIEIDTKADPPYTGIENNDYHALEAFFEGLDYEVISIDYGDTQAEAPKQAA